MGDAERASSGAQESDREWLERMVAQTRKDWVRRDRPPSIRVPLPVLEAVLAEDRKSNARAGL